MSRAYYLSTQQQSFARILPDLIAHRGLLRNVVWKELRARYRNAMMGFLWAVLQPVMMMLILTFVFKYLLGERLAEGRDAEFQQLVVEGLQSHPFSP